MVCKKCGKEILKEENFCTNCGKAINNVQSEENNTNIKDNKENLDKKKSKVFKKLIIILAVILLVIIICVGAVILNNRKAVKQNQEENQNNSGVETIEKEYITQNSEVSPTGKEFIGEFSENLTNVYPEIIKGNAKSSKDNYNTSVEKMNQFSLKMLLSNNTITELNYYYNSENNKFIGSRNAINDIDYYQKILQQNKQQSYSNIEEVMDTFCQRFDECFSRFS